MQDCESDTENISIYHAEKLYTTLGKQIICFRYIRLNILVECLVIMKFY